MKDNVPMLSQSQLNDAPWMQEELPPTQVDCTVCYCISKSMPVWVENYTKLEGEEDFSDTNLVEEFKTDDKAIGIPTLLKELQKLCEEKIVQLKIKGIGFDDNSKGVEQKILEQIKHYQEVLKASKDWVVDDLDVCKDE